MCGVCDVVHYLYCVTFSGKDMRGDWKVETEKGWTKRDPSGEGEVEREKLWVKRDPGFFWLPHLPQLVLHQLVHLLSYRFKATRCKEID